MDLTIKIDVPDWDPNPDKTTTNNHNWRKCVVVMFPNCSFKWIPTYKQLDQIKDALEKCENLNKDLAIKNFYGKV